MDITVGPLVNLWGFGPDKQPVHIPTQAQIDAAKAQTGLSHLKVVNEAHRNYLQKICPSCMWISRPLVKVMPPIIWHD